jgi:hypothetical protein
MASAMAEIFKRQSAQESDSNPKMHALGRMPRNSNCERQAMNGVVTLKSGLTAPWRFDGQHIHLDHDDYKKSPMKLLPGKTAKASAMWMLKELDREIKLGATRKR